MAGLRKGDWWLIGLSAGLTVDRAYFPVPGIHYQIWLPDDRRSS